MKWKLEIDHGGKMCTWHAAYMPHAIIFQFIEGFLNLGNGHLQMLLWFRRVTPCSKWDPCYKRLYIFQIS